MSLILKYDLGNPHRLPVGYTPLAYIESTGTLWIDTETYFDATTIRSFKVLFTQQISNWVYGENSNGPLEVLIGPRSYLGGGFDTNVWKQNKLYDILISTITGNMYMKVNGETIRTSTGSANGYKDFLFALASNGNIAAGKSWKLYNYLIFSNGILIKEFIPAKRNSDGVIGMFDIVSQTFKTNAGTGAFIAGPEVVVLPYEYLLVEYLLSNGVEYIDTGVTIGSGNTFKCTWADVFNSSGTKITGSTENKAYGQGNTTGATPNISGGGRISGSNILIWINGSNYTSGIASTNSTHIYTDTITCTSYAIQAVMTDLYTGTNYINANVSTTSYATGHIFLFRDSSGAYPYYGIKKIYNCTITGTNARNFIPCYRRSDLKPGMYDTVNNVFYTNSGSGEFILGPVVEESSRQLEYNNAGSNYIGKPTNVHHSTSNPSSTLINLGSGDFNGSSSYIQSNSNIGFSGDPNISISAWVKCTDSTWNTDYVGIVGGTTYATGLNWFLMLKSGRPDFDFWSCRVIASNAISLNLWHHIVVTKSPGTLSTSTVKIYVDGLAVAAATESARVPTIVNTPVQIGRANSAGRFFHGYISDVRIYDNVLTADEVLKIYKGGL